MTDNTPTPKVWVGCLAAYNAGHLHGRWIDATQSPEEIDEEIQDVLATSPIPEAEEPDIFDTDDMHGVSPTSCTGEAIAELGAYLEEFGELGAVILQNSEDIEQARTTMQEDYRGRFDDLADYAAEYVESTGDLEKVPEWLRGHIDYESIARDWACGGDIYTIEMNGGVEVFVNR